MNEGRFGPGRLALALGLVAIAFLALRPAVDPDYGWHLANGRHLADAILLGGADVYSWTAAGAAWIAHEWLTEAAMAGLNDWLGPTAVSIVAALLVATAFGLVALRSRRRAVSRTVTLLTIGVGFAATLVSMAVRPQLLELLYLAATLLVVDAWLDSHLPRTRLWLIVGAAALFWANTHGSFLLLPAVLGLVALGTVTGRERRWWEMAVAAGIAAVVPLANPWGLALYGFAAQSLTSSVTGRLVQEWQPPDLLAPSFSPFTVGLALAAIGTLGALANRMPTRPNTRLASDLLVAIAILVLAIRSGRHVMLFGIAAAPLIAGGWSAVGRAVGRLRPATTRMPPKAALDARGRDVIDGVVFVVVVVALAVAGLVVVGPDAQQRATDARYPTALLPALDATYAQHPGARLFNEYTWGGFLESTRPGVHVFIDGRSEVYGDAQLERYAQIAAGGPDALDALATLGVDLVLIKTDSPLARALGGSGQWLMVASDDVGTLFARPNL